MTILMTADTVGGVWTYALELARALQGAEETQITLATMGAPLSSSQWAQVERLPFLRVAESDFKLEWMENPWEDVARAGDWLLDLEREVSPDIVHLNGFAHAVSPFAAPTVVVAHSCVWSWWRAVKGDAPPRGAWDRYQDAVRRGLQAADAVVAPTRAMFETLAENYGPLPAPVETRVIPNCRDASLFTSVIPKEPFIFSAGRLWDEAKNIATLAEAARSGLPCPLYVAGQSAEPCRNADDAGGGDALRGLCPLGFLAPLEMARWLERASAYALPARYEPFGLSVLEAGLAGCALALGDIPSLREVWGAAALYVAPGDATAWRSALCGLMESPNERERLGRAAQQRAREYMPARTATGYLSLYRELRQGGERKI